jgi:hypothetical protein
MVRVDPLTVWPTKLRIFKSGSSHLTADTLDELHAFAKRIGLRREWFQEHPIMPHYDLTPQRFAAAVALGAVVVPMRQQLRDRRSR